MEIKLKTPRLYLLEWRPIDQFDLINSSADKGLILIHQLMSQLGMTRIVKHKNKIKLKNPQVY